MKKLAFLFWVSMLAGCGAGSTATSGGSPPAVVPVTQPPAPSAGAVILSNADININTTSGDYKIQAASGVNVTVSRTSNRVDFTENQAAGAVDISGTSNEIIFRKGTSASSLSVDGTSNTVWIPEGAAIAISGIPSTSTSFRYYTPP